MSKRLLLIGVLFLAFCLRLFGLSKFPAGFTPDEAAQGYTAYSILKTGKDEWGVRLPLNPRSFGDFKPPLNTYLIIPSIAVFGLNEFSVRLPNALLGSLSILVVYLLVKQLESESLAITASLFLAISPWHISLSRGAFEANLTTFFLPAGALFFLKGLKSFKFLLFSGFLFGINLLSYHSAKIASPLILFFLIFRFRNELKIIFLKSPKIIFFSGLIFSLFLFIAFSGLFSGAGTRPFDIGIFSGGWQDVSYQRFFAVKKGLPDFLARFFNNKLVFFFSELTRSYFSYLSPQFLFTQGAGEASYGMIPGKGVLYLIELPFMITSFYFLIKERKKSWQFFWFWLAISPLPAALARGVGYHANRAAVMMPAVQILSALGALKLLGLLKKYKKYYLLIFLTFGFCLSASFAFFIEDYFFQADKINAPKMSYGLKEVMILLKGEKKRVIFSRTISEPQVYVMFYNQIDPLIVQSQTNSWLEYQKSGQFVDQLGDYFLENFEFRNFSFPEDWDRKEVVFVGSAKDFLGQERIISDKLMSLDKFFKKVMTEKVVHYPDGEPAFRIFSL